MNCTLYSIDTVLYCVRDIFACLLVSVREARTCHVTDRVTGASLGSMRCVQMRELLVVCLCFVDPWSPDYVMSCVGL